MFLMAVTGDKQESLQLSAVSVQPAARKLTAER